MRGQGEGRKDRMARTRKAVPAALAMTHHVVLEDGVVRSEKRPLVGQLAPTDPLRLRHVASDSVVVEALNRVRASHVRVREALKAAASSPEGGQAHREAVQAHASALRELEVAVLTAERQRAVTLRGGPDLNRLSREVGATRGDQPAALQRMLRRFPQAADPLLWDAEDCRRYLRAILFWETKRIAAARMAQDSVTARELKSLRTAQADWRRRNRDRADAARALDSLLARAQLTDRQRAGARAELDGAPLTRPFSTRERALLVKKLRKVAEM